MSSNNNDKTKATATAEERLAKLLSISEECDCVDELAKLVESGQPFKAYNGFEPSGRIHIAQALVTVRNANVITWCGGTMVIYIADWFAQLNHKMGGDMDKIKQVGQYFIEVFKASGLDLDNCKFVWASELINATPTYWPRVLDIASKTSVDRAKRCTQIMGRTAQDALDVSQLIYPLMQAADAFELDGTGVDICQLGLDQRKANMLVREYAGKVGLKPPISLCHHMLLGLKYNASKAPKKADDAATAGLAPEEKLVPGAKMSKSDPDSAIFMDDSTAEIVRKINGAFCNDDPKDNPVFEYFRYIVLPWCSPVTLFNKTYNNHEELAADFPAMNKAELKAQLAKYIDSLVEPVRKHFDSTPELSALRDRVASYRVTR